MKDRLVPILFAVLAAAFYAVSAPLSKELMQTVPAAFMAAFLYLGAGVGVGILYLFQFPKEEPAKRLDRKDLPYTVGMILLDILAPVFLMFGIRYGTAANASLLGNFEIVATTVIALVLFKERVSKRLWAAIALITASSLLLSFEGAGSLRFSHGSLLVLLATACWGLENNCTRSISEKSTFEIVTLKGLCSGGGAFVLALLLGERLPNAASAVSAMLLGFVSYGLSIFLYIRAQRDLGAAKTSACYAVAPFIGAFLSFVLAGETPTGLYLVSALVMVAGTFLVAMDTLIRQHVHTHSHSFTHIHGGVLHTHTIVHSHPHTHCTVKGSAHRHHHSRAELEAALAHSHH